VTDDSRGGLLTLTTTDGVGLEAELRLPSSDQVAPVTGGVVLCHPHPQQGGSMDAGVVAELFRLLPDRGMAALRFNFRGVGRSGGVHGHGRAEAADVVAAVAALAERWPHRPLLLAGWSFGGDVSLAVTDERIDGWVGIAPPLMVLPPEELASAAGADARPTLLAVPEHDQIRPPAAATEATIGWSATTVRTVPGADHFLVGRAGVVADLVVGFAASFGAAGT
jgi:alpha/beta superfamily hydrolase